MPLNERFSRCYKKSRGISNVDLADRVALSATPMEREGFITRYVALTDPTQLNLHTQVFIQVSLNNTSTESLRDFAARIRVMPAKATPAFLMRKLEENHVLIRAVGDLEFVNYFEFPAPAEQRWSDRLKCFAPAEVRYIRVETDS